MENKARSPKDTAVIKWLSRSLELHRLVDLQIMRTREAQAQQSIMESALSSKYGGSLCADQLQRITDEVEERQSQLSESIINWLDARNEISNAIDDYIPDVASRIVFIHRYIFGETWQEVAEATGREDPRYLFQKHKAALSKFPSAAELTVQYRKAGNATGA